MKKAQGLQPLQQGSQSQGILGPKHQQQGLSPERGDQLIAFRGRKPP